MPWIYLAIAIVAEVIATSALKFSDGFTRLLPTVFVILGYGVAFYFLSLTIKTIPLGVVYAIWSGVGIALITLVSWLLFGQKLDFFGVVGILLIGAGIAVINLYSDTGTH